MKTLSLDIGDAWTGSAISDELGIIAQPYKTIPAHELENFITETLAQEKKIDTIVVGHPRTLKNTESEQTKKVVATKELLEKKFPTITWVLWDERLTSKQAAKIKGSRTKEEKLKQHSIAAALILSTYLDFKKFSY